jgi:hypothetical protein
VSLRRPQKKRVSSSREVRRTNKIRVKEGDKDLRKDDYAFCQEMELNSHIIVGKA